MKTIELPNDFRDALPIVAKAAPHARAWVPILQTILITASCDDGLAARATDLEVSCAYVTHVEVPEGPEGCRDWAVALDARMVADFAADAKKKGLRVSLTFAQSAEASYATLATVDRTVRLESLLTENFPPLVHVTNKVVASASLPFVELREAYLRVSSCAAQKPVHGGTYIEFWTRGLTDVLAQPGLAFTSTDGYGAAHTVVAVRKTLFVNNEHSAILPGCLRKMMMALPKKFEKETSDAVIEVSASLASINIAGYNVVARLVDGHYPNVRGIVPKVSDDCTIEISPSALVDAVKNTGDLTDKQRTIAMESKDFGATVTISCDGSTSAVNCRSGIAGHYAFPRTLLNASNLLRVLGSFDPHAPIIIAYTGALKVLAFLQGKSLALLMPLSAPTY
jgi:DNA polymerase III sliding clamp (beta) subunit (PCNA family)